MRSALSAAVGAAHPTHRPIAHVAGRDDGGKPRVLLLAHALDVHTSDPWILLKAKRHHGAYTIGAPASLENLVSIEHESPTAFRLIFDTPQNTLGWSADEPEDAETFVAAVAECVLGADLGPPSPTTAAGQTHPARSAEPSDEPSPRLDRVPHSPYSDSRSTSTVVTEPDAGPSTRHPPPSPGTPKDHISESEWGPDPPQSRPTPRLRRALMDPTPEPSPEQRRRTRHPPPSPGTPKENLSESEWVPDPPQARPTPRLRRATKDPMPETSPPTERQRRTRHGVSLPNAKPKSVPTAHFTAKPKQLAAASGGVSRRGHARIPDQPTTPPLSPPAEGGKSEAEEAEAATPRAHPSVRRQAPRRSMSADMSADMVLPSPGRPEPTHTGRRGRPAARLSRSADTLPIAPAYDLETDEVNVPEAATIRPRGRRVAKSASASAPAHSSMPAARSCRTGQKVHPKPIPVGKRRKRMRARPFDPRAFEQRLIEGTPYTSIESALKAMQQAKSRKLNIKQGLRTSSPDPAPAVEEDEAAWAEAEELLSTIGYGLNVPAGERRTVRAGDAIGATLQAELAAAEGGYHIGLLGAVAGTSNRPWRSARHPAPRRTNVQDRILTKLHGQRAQEDWAEGPTWSLVGEDDVADYGLFDSREVDELLDGVDAALDELDLLSGFLDSAEEGVLSAVPDVVAIRKRRHGEQLATANFQVLAQELSDLLASGRLPRRAPQPRERSASRVASNSHLTASLRPHSRPDPHPRRSDVSPVHLRKSIDVARLNQRRSMDVGRVDPRRSMDVGRLESRRAPDPRLASRRSMDVGRFNTRRSMDVGRVDPRMSMDVGRIDTRNSMDVGRIDPRMSMDVGRVDPRMSMDVGRIDPRMSMDVGRIDPRMSVDMNHPNQRSRKMTGQSEQDMRLAPPRRSLDVNHRTSRLNADRRRPSGTEDNLQHPSQRRDMDNGRNGMDVSSQATARPLSSMSVQVPVGQKFDQGGAQPQMGISDAMNVLLSAPLTAQGDHVAKLEAAAVEVYKHHLGSADSSTIDAVSRFASRFVTFARQMLSVSVSRPTSASATGSSHSLPLSKPGGPPQGLALSKAIETALEPYCGLVLFIREMAPGSYRALIDEYVAAVRGACYNASQWERPEGASLAPNAAGAASPAPGSSFAASLTATVRLMHAVAGLMASQHSFVIDFLHLSSVQITFADYLGLNPELVAQASELRQGALGRQGNVRLEPVLDQVFAPAVHAVQARVDQERERGLAPIALLAGLESALAPRTGPNAPSDEGMEYALSTLKGISTRLLADVDDLVQKETGMLQHLFDSAPSLVPTEEEKGRLGRKLTLKRRSSVQQQGGNEAHVLLCTGRVPDWILQAEAQMRLAARAMGSPVPWPKSTQARLDAAGEKLGRTAVGLINARAGMARRFATQIPEAHGQLVRVINMEALHHAAVEARAKAACRSLDELVGRTERLLQDAVAGYTGAMLHPLWGPMHGFLIRVEQVADPLRQSGTEAHVWAGLVEDFSPESVHMLVQTLGREVRTHFHLALAKQDARTHAAQLVWTSMELAMVRDVDRFRALALDVFRSDPSGLAMDVLAWSVDGSSLSGWFRQASPLGPA